MCFSPFARPATTTLWPKSPRVHVRAFVAFSPVHLFMDQCRFHVFVSSVKCRIATMMTPGKIHCVLNQQVKKLICDETLHARALEAQ